MQDLQGSLLGRKAVHLPSGGCSWPAVEDIQCPGSVLGEAGAGTGHREEQAQGAHPACVLTGARVRHQGHSVWQVVEAEPEAQAGEWMAAEAGKGPGAEALTEGQARPGWAGPCLSHSC